MFAEQEYLREQVRKLKWQENISYKEIAEELLNMNYNSFMNYLHGYKNLGSTRVKILKDYINTLMQ